LLNLRPKIGKRNEVFCENDVKCVGVDWMCVCLHRQFNFQFQF